MRLFAKIFLCVAFSFSIAFLLSGYFLITFSYENAVQREIDYAINLYQYDKFSVQAGLITNEAYFFEDISPKVTVLSSFASELNGQAAFFSSDKSLLFSNFIDRTDLSIVNDVVDTSIHYRFQTTDDRNYIVTCGKITQNEVSLYLLTASDISEMVGQQKLMMQRFRQVYFIILLMSMFLILILTAFLTQPIKRLTETAGRIADGNYSERLSVSGRDEVGELAEKFNLMVDAIENKMNELSENARQKEDFVANFAHELKTPLTSVIGYADMLYQQNLSQKEVKNAAWYIWNEGMRLESLSMKLMDLIILNRQDFLLEEMSAVEILKDVAQGLTHLMEEKSISFQLKADAATVKVDYDLFKTLLINIIDNSQKSGCTMILVEGKQSNDQYCLSVHDNGRGIPASEIERITEAFYMVDKSRSRKQHGAGLGLALAERIAEIHGSHLKFYSDGATGTVVQINLSCKGGAIIMNRRGIYTVVGITLSFCLVFGGWFLTEILLNNKEKELLSGDGAVQN